MKARVLKTDKLLGVKKGEIYEVQPYGYDRGKLTLLRRVPDGYNPMCNHYLHEVEIIKEL